MRYSLKSSATMGAATGVAGLIAAVWSLYIFGPDITRQVPSIWFLIAAGGGACAAGAAVSPFLGRPAAKGALISLASFFVATISGAILAGLVLPSVDRLDPVAFWLIFTFCSPIFVLWLGLWGALHFATRRLRERFI